MDNFEELLDATGEVGYVDQVVHSIVYVSGLPKARPSEVVYFETGEIGQIISLTPDYVETLLLSNSKVGVGTRVARSDQLLKVAISQDILGKTINPLGVGEDQKVVGGEDSQTRLIDVPPVGLNIRKNISQPFETGVSMIDLIVPLGLGQRELIIGDRKTGKTQLLLQSLVYRASMGMVCVYAAIAKKRMDLTTIEGVLKEKGVRDNIAIVATSSSDPSGLIYLAPFTAMTIAEYFRDMGRDVYIVLDDLSAHAKAYREIMLLAKRFPGRNSYPGDIFYLHSKLLERAGNFEYLRKDSKEKLNRQEVSITCLPVAELSMGDLSGYIQTNLMAMTDGHIFLDSDLYNQGRRPAINPFLSVTRVGRQAQSSLLRDLNRQVTKFLVYIEKLREFMHFGAELSESTKRTLAMGDRIISLLDQPADREIPVNVSTVLIATVWGGNWRETAINEMKRQAESIAYSYITSTQYKNKIDQLIAQSSTFDDLVTKIRNDTSLVLGQAVKPAN